MSLVPSVTECLVAWGVAPVGVTRFCERPELSAVGGTKDPDLDRIVALAPDLVVMDDEENRADDHAELVRSGLVVHVTHVRALADVAPCLRGLADAVGVTVDVPDLAVPDPPTVRTAFVPIWRRPWMTLSSDTYGSSLLASAGIGNVFARDPARYPEVSLEEAASRRPDLVLAPSEPYPFGERHVAELQAVAPVVRLVDGRDLFWWGVRTPGALHRLRVLVAS